jgi:hypothetical protein
MNFLKNNKVIFLLSLAIGLFVAFKMETPVISTNPNYDPSDANSKEYLTTPEGSLIFFKRTIGFGAISFASIWLLRFLF